MFNRTRKTLAAGAVTAALALSCTFLPGCAAQPAASGSSAVQSAAATTFQEKSVPVVHNAGESGTITLRFYDDMPNVAYVSATDFHVMMNPSATAEAQKKDASWTVTSTTGSAVVDTDADTISSDDFYAFANIERVPADGSAGVSLPCVQLLGSQAEPQTATITFDLGKYGIDLRADDKGVYLPLTLATSLYCNDDTAHRAAFNGEKMYVNDLPMILTMMQMDPTYSTPLLTQLTRPEDLAAHSTAEWRFALENLYGYPGSAVIDGTILREQGLEAALKAYGSAGEKAWTLLQSTDTAEYLMGASMLNALFNDGHTTLALDAMNQVFPDTAPELYEAFSAQRQKYTAEQDVLALFEDGMGAASAAAYDDLGRVAQRTQALGEGNIFTQGDTMIVSFSSFSANSSAWEEYYASSERDLDALLSSEAAQKDSLMIFLKALRQAQANPEIKNIVLDLTDNSGGDSNVLMAIMSFMTNEKDLNYEDVLTGQKVALNYAIDRNLDGVFDEQDDKVSYDYNFAVLTSAKSFSCGNALPSMMKDAGMPVLGERSRGGSCMMMPLSTAEGFDYSISGYRSRLINKAGENIDVGVPVDVDLTQRGADGSTKTTDVEIMAMGTDGTEQPQQHTMTDYSQFWDFSALSKAVNDFYAAK